jgi:NAD(P)-dependent dehydrogenase (short-subunit alcohol dehydrogenase family)
MQLSNKTALISGAQQGIGAAIALEFARQGANLVLNYLDDAAAVQGVADRAQGLGARVLVLQGDVSRIDTHADLVAAADRHFGGLDILVNNAAVFPRAHFLDLTPEVWDLTMGVNLRGMAFLSQAFARALRARKRPGSIIGIASGAVNGWEKSGHYAASKGGMVSLIRSMAYDLAADGIRVNAIAPGITDTAQPRGGYDEAQLKALVAGLPIPRMGQPDEIATVATFLAGSASSYMTGQTIHVNGGAFMA